MGASFTGKEFGCFPVMVEAGKHGQCQQAYHNAQHWVVRPGTPLLMPRLAPPASLSPSFL